MSYPPEPVIGKKYYVHKVHNGYLVSDHTNGYTTYICLTLDDVFSKLKELEGAE